MKWFFRWWMRGFDKLQADNNARVQAEGAAFMATHFEGGMEFQLVDAENGKILKVKIPNPSGNNPHGFNPRGNTKEKLYVIPEGENVIEFVTRALVEERIK